MTQWLSFIFLKQTHHKRVSIQLKSSVVKGLDFPFRSSTSPCCAWCKPIPLQSLEPKENSLYHFAGFHDKLQPPGENCFHSWWERRRERTNFHPSSHNNNNRNIHAAMTLNCLVLGLKWASFLATDNKNDDLERNTEVLWEIPATLPQCPPQIPNGMPWDYYQTSAMNIKYQPSWSQVKSRWVFTILNNSSL